jgi:hypothetical protein
MVREDEKAARVFAAFSGNKPTSPIVLRNSARCFLLILDRIDLAISKYDLYNRAISRTVGASSSAETINLLYR